MKAFRKWGFRRVGGRRGFTLIELLIVMVILAILAGVVVMAVGNIITTSGARAYDVSKGEIRNAVVDFVAQNNGALPGTTGSAYNVSVLGSNVSCTVLDMSDIVGSDKLLSALPDGCFLDAGGDDNCDGGATGCLATSHYTWVLDGDGNVYSDCTGSDCTATLTDDYQDVWP